MADEQKELDLLTETQIEAPLFSHIVRVNPFHGGVYLRFFFIPPSGSRNIKLAASLWIPIDGAIGLVTSLQGILTQMTKQSPKKTSKKTVN